MKHDQRFKNLIQMFFRLYMEISHPKLAARLDFNRVEWIKTELVQTELDGGLHFLDLVAKVFVRADDQGNYQERLLVIFVEVESAESANSLRSRLPVYYFRVCGANEGYDVLPLAIYLNAKMEGIGFDRAQHRFEDDVINEFTYRYIALKGMDAVEYVQRENWLGVALSVLMRVSEDQKARVSAEALRKISEAELTETERFHLAECVHAYQKLNEEQEREYRRIISGKRYEGAKAMNQTVYEKGLETGLEKGRQEGRLEGRQEGRLEGRQEGQKSGVLRSVQRALSARFGLLSPAVDARLEKLPVEHLETFLDRMFQVSSLKELGLED